MRIVGVSGSTRKRSYNTALLREAGRLLPVGATLEIVDISNLPLFGQDLEVDVPEAVRVFKEKIRSADSVLLATPEYNRSISAALKNAIEWGSRPDEDNSWDEKAGAIISASTSPRGGVRAQMQLRQICVDLNVHVMNGPELFVANAAEQFDGDLRLTNEALRKRLEAVVHGLVTWTAKIRATPMSQQ